MLKSEKWHTFCAGHPKFNIAGDVFTHISFYQYCSLTFDYPNPVKHFHVQVRIMDNFGLEHNKWECRVLIGQFTWLKTL